MTNVRIAEIKQHNGLPTLFINGEPVPFAVYACYLDDRARYEDFSAAGYRLFTFPCYFAGRGINTQSGIGLFRRGIFDSPEPDFTEFDNEAMHIVSACPDALIFPRVCMTMPEWWDEKYPDEINYTQSGKRLRHSMSSEQWRKDAAEMFLKIIRHIESMPYAGNIIGYHIAAGTTEEWYHFSGSGDPGGYGPVVQKDFSVWAKGKYGEEACTWKIPETYPEYQNNGEAFISSHNKSLLAFLEYTSEIIARDIVYFCSRVKEFTKGTKITGAFYGYTVHFGDPQTGHHALRTVLESKDVDFICSPNSYLSGPEPGPNGTRIRQPGTDWPSMPPLDSIRLAGKLFINENDTRTCLSRPLKEARAGIAPEGQYESGVWLGPERKDWSLSLIRRSFARTMITGAGGWWFDMWGGWYADPDMMAEMKACRAILTREINLPSRQSTNQVALINDERAAKHLNQAAGIIMPWLVDLRLKLAQTGTGYDVYDIFSADKIPLEQYRLLVFACVGDSPELRRLAVRAREKGVHLLFSYLPGYGTAFDLSAVREITGIPLDLTEPRKGELCSRDGTVLAAAGPFSPGVKITGTFDKEIGSFAGGEPGLVQKRVGNSDTWYSALPGLETAGLRLIQEQAGVHHYTEPKDIVYAGRNFLCIHAASAGIKRIRLPVEAKVSDCFGTFTQEGSQFEIPMELFETKVFHLS